MPRTYSIESELRAAITICDGTAELRAQLLALLTEQHFAGVGTVELFARLSGLSSQNKAIPRLTVLRQDPALSDDARDILDTPLTACVDVDDAAALMDQLEMFRKLRCIYQGTRDVVDNIKESTPETVDNCLKALENVLLQARNQAEEIKLATTNQQYADDVMAQVLSQTPPDRIPTGFAAFDEANGGFARRELALVASTTGGGKSVMAEQLAINAYLYGCKNVALCSFEMSEEDVFARLISNLTEIPFNKVYMKRLNVKQRKYCDVTWNAFKQHGERNGCIFTVFSPTFAVDAGQLANIVKPGGYDMVLVDYVGLVDQDKNKQLWDNLGEITKQLKNSAKAQNNVWVAFAQLDEDSNKVKYAKAMKHHSSYLWQWNYGEEQANIGQLTVDQGKARNGKVFPFELLANFSIMQLQDPRDGRTARRFLADAVGDAALLDDAASTSPEELDGSKDEVAAPKPREPVARRFQDRLSYQLGNLTDEPLEQDEI